MKDTTARRLSKLHKLLLRATGGRVGRRFVSNDMLLLSTLGRRTGRTHTVPLLYLEGDDRLVVIASWGGRDCHPDWYLNLTAHPEAVVAIGGHRRTVGARLTDGEERAAWWDRAVAAYPGYKAYQLRTEREIPVIVLEPRAESREPTAES